MNSQQPDPSQDPNQNPGYQDGSRPDDQLISSTSNRSFQRENPDVLQDLVHQRNTKSMPSVQKMTSDNVRSLRTAGKKETSTGVGFTRMIAGIFGGFWAMISGLFSVAPRVNKHKQCNEYGHVPPEPGTWHGDFPTCLECGREITSVEELRTSRDRYSRFDKPKAK